MVRRSTVERSPHSAEHGLAYEAGTEYSEPDGIVRSRSARTWGGAGGRWLVWLFRGIAWAVLLLIGFRGVMAIVSSETSPGSAAAPAPSASAATASFPVSLADAYALQFGQIYLNYSPADAAQRASQLSDFLPPGSDPQLGWSGTGSSQLQSEQVAGTEVRDAHHAIVTLLARVNGQLLQLGVPIYAASGALTVTGAPAWLPAPARAALPSSPPASTDQAAAGQLERLLPDFFAAYSSGNQETLSRFLAPRAVLTGLNGAVTYRSLAMVTVPPGGTTRHITASVVWNVPARDANGRAARHGAAAQLTMSYALTVVKRSGTWYVSDISAANDPPGAP